MMRVSVWIILMNCVSVCVFDDERECVWILLINFV